MVDLTRDRQGMVRAPLLGPRARPVRHRHRVWLDARDPAFRAEVKQAALAPFRGDANTLRDSPWRCRAGPRRVHVVELGTQVVDEVRRGVQQEQLGRGGHKNDPLHEIRGPR